MVKENLDFEILGWYEEVTNGYKEACDGIKRFSTFKINTLYILLLNKRKFSFKKVDELRKDCSPLQNFSRLLNVAIL